MQGYPVEDASIKIVEKWGLGSKKQDKGVLLLISLAERKIRIEVGQGLEGDLPDAIAKRIIDEVIAPHFKRQDPSRGVLEGVIQIISQVAPDFDSATEFGVSPKRQKKGVSTNGLVLMLLIALFLLRMLTRLGGMGGGGGGFLGGGGGWSGGGGGWSSGGGSSWSGGGGGFSGGGASGSW